LIRDFFMKKIIQNILVKSIGGSINLLSFVAPKQSLTLAYKLFSEPRKGKINKNKIPRTLEKCILQTHTLHGHDFCTYHWEGNSEVILLAHGWESNASRWKKTLPYLKKTGKTIIAMDAPAHGFNTNKEFNVPLYSEFIDLVVKKYNPTIAIGHSIGGNALAYYQKNYSQNFEKLILLGSPSDFKIIMHNYFKMLGYNNKVQMQFQNYVWDRFNIKTDDFNASEFLKDCTIKGLVAHDQNDYMVLVEEGKKIANSWKTSELIITNGLGHSMHDASLYEKIVDFIAS
jgi:predicted alpha/beta hydrolase family esterase